MRDVIAGAVDSGYNFGVDAAASFLEKCVVNFGEVLNNTEANDANASVRKDLECFIRAMNNLKIADEIRSLKIENKS